MMVRQALMASGYLSIFLMPALLLLGVHLGHPTLAFGAVMLVFPLARLVFGAAQPGAGSPWHESLATLLHWLPVLYGLLLPIVVVLLLVSARCRRRRHDRRGDRPWPESVDDHALCHLCWSRTPPPSSASGHPCGSADRGHERLPNAWLRAPAAPRTATRYVACGLSAGWRVGMELRVAALCAHLPRGIRRQHRSAALHRALQPCVRRGHARLDPDRRRLRVGRRMDGLAVYLGAALGVHFGIQLITYLQHWALGDDTVSVTHSQAAWENDCQFQAWITLSISFHQGHHEAAHRPYYLVGLAKDSPRAPAGYVLLMLVCMVPPLWRQLMQPAIEHWRAQPLMPTSAGRRLTCFAIYPRQSDALES